MAETMVQAKAQSTAQSATNPVPARPSRGRWYVLLLISAMYLITYLDRVNISTAAPLISKEFGFDKVTMGVIFSAFVWAYAMFQVPGGWLSDRLGARGVLGGIVTYWSVMTAATAAAFGSVSFIVVRFLFGVGEAGAFPAPRAPCSFGIRKANAASCKALLTAPAGSAPRSRRRWWWSS